MVFCPGTHRFFDRPAHPLPQLLAAGVPLGLGTDSAASNRGLSLLAEMREVRRTFPQLAPATVFALATGSLLGSVLPGAGTLSPGGAADVAVTELGATDPDAGGKDPLGAVLDGSGETLLTVAGGRVVYRRGGAGE